MLLTLAMHAAGSYSAARGGDVIRQPDEKPANQEAAWNADLTDEQVNMTTEYRTHRCLV